MIDVELVLYAVRFVGAISGAVEVQIFANYAKTFVKYMVRIN